MLPRRARHLPLLLLAALAALTVVAPAATADVFTPEGGPSPNGASIDTLYKITFYIGVVVFLIVEGTLFWSLFRDRFKRGAPPPEQIRGNTRLEVGWTVGAAVILIVIAVITFAMLPGIKNPEESGPNGLQAAKGVQYAATDQPPPPDGRGLNIRVVGQQYIWRYDYPGRERLFTYTDLVVPVNTTITLEITSSDVIHSYWVPELFGKADGVPGHINRTWFKVTEPGRYSGACAELCGENHAQMRNTVTALPVDQYQAWAARQIENIKAAQQGLAETRRQRDFVVSE